MPPLAPVQYLITEDKTEVFTYLEIAFMNTGTTVLVINDEFILMPGEFMKDGNPLNIRHYRGQFNIRFQEEVGSLLDPFSRRRQFLGNRLLVRIVE